MFRPVIAAVWVVVLCLSGFAADEQAVPADAGAAKTALAPAVQPKPLSQNVDRGLAWLAQHQLDSGAWGQGEESAGMGGGAKLKDIPSVADTCVAALAMLRSGSTPAQGPYAKNVLSAVNFLCAQVEEADKDSLYITSTRDTRVQAKLGPYIDTFLACLLLTEAQEKMPDKASLARVSTALEKVLHKIQKNQRADGTWDGRGWAPALSQAMAAKGINRAAQSGAPVDEAVREKAERYAREQVDASGKVSGAGSAGVELYAFAASVGAQNDSAGTNIRLKAESEEKLRDAKTDVDRKDAQATLDRIDSGEKDLDRARASMVSRLEDKQFIAGFGSNGGEEFLSYMNIGEALVVKGGEDWQKWDQSITENLNRIQNTDGSWTGHHCITGRTFCTSSALLVLMVDRTPMPIAAKFARR